MWPFVYNISVMLEPSSKCCLIIKDYNVSLNILVFSNANGLIFPCTGGLDVIAT